MLVRCEANSGKALPERARIRHETDLTEFTPLKVGATYHVYGLMISVARIDFFICPPENNPFWFPASLFSVQDGRLPNNWCFGFTLGNPGFAALYEEFKVEALLGYPELVKNYEHYAGVLERDEFELRKFFREKISIDRWYVAICNDQTLGLA
jgi:hypothetical protein